MKYPVHLLLLLTILILAACSESPTPAASTHDPSRTPVRTAPVEQVSTTPAIQVTGLIASSNEARPSFKTGGVIRRLLVDEGDRVQQGQLLATLDLTEIGAQVGQAREGLNKAERDLQRARRLLQDSVATREQVQNAETAFEIARRQVEVATFNQTYSEVRSPISGRVIRKLMNEGEITGPGNPVYAIVGSGAGDWVLQVGLTDRDWVQVREGDPAVIRLDAYPGQTMSGVISRLAPVADPTTGTFPIEIRIQPGDRKLAVGMIASAELRLQGGQQRLRIPLESLVSSEGKQARVFVLDGQTARERTITIDQLAGYQVWVVDGLQADERVITAGAPYLVDGQLVQAQ